MIIFYSIYIRSSQILINNTAQNKFFLSEATETKKFFTKTIQYINNFGHKFSIRIKPSFINN